MYTVIVNRCQIGGTEQRNMIFPFWASTEETYLEGRNVVEKVYDLLRCERKRVGPVGSLDAGVGRG